MTDREQLTRILNAVYEWKVACSGSGSRNLIEVEEAIRRETGIARPAAQLDAERAQPEQV